MRIVNFRRSVKRVLIAACFIPCMMFAQAPQGINYQGVARDYAGSAISKSNIAVEIKLWQGNPNSGGSIVYSELHPSTPTDTFGLYSLVIGSTSGSGTGTFNTVPWSGGNIWVEVYIDPTNGTSYSLVSQQQLMSVPYALYAAQAGGSGAGLDSVRGPAHNIPKFNKFGNTLRRSIINESLDSSSIGIGTVTPNQNAALEVANTGVPGQAGKGLLIPRMSYSERTQISTSALTHGLLVYQTQPSTVFPEGFWYWDAYQGTWLLLAPAQAVWTLSGNALTTPGSNYLGTMDDNDMVLKTGNGSFQQFERMRMRSQSNGGNIQFGDPSVNKHYVFPAAKGNAGEFLQLDPTGTSNNLVWTSGGGSTTFWSHAGNFLFPTSFSTDSVGIGSAASNPKAMLDVSSATGKSLYVTSSGTDAAAQIETNNATNTSSALVVSSFASSGNALDVTSFNADAVNATANDAPAIRALNTSNGAATIDAFNNGTHSVAYFHNSSVTGAAPVLYAIQADAAGYSAQFVGGKGITTDAFQLSTNPNSQYVLQSDAGGFGTWTVPTWSITGTTMYPSNLGLFVGIGTSAPTSPLHVVGGGSSALFAQNTAGNDAISGTTSGGGSGVFGSNGGNGSGVTGFSTGSGNAGFFQSANQTNTANALEVSHQGKGTVGYFYNTLNANTNPVISADNVGGGPTISANTTGTGSAANFSVNNPSNASSAMNVTTNGTGFALNVTNTGTLNGAGNFQVTTNTSTAPAVQIGTSSPAPALKVNGNTGAGAIAALFNGGAVGVGTGTVAPSSGLDVKTSLGVSVKTYTPGNYSIAPADQNVVHIFVGSGTSNVQLPSAALCPGRLLIFTSDQGTGGAVNVIAASGQFINGAASLTITVSTGANKPSYGIISDGTNWQIIFKN